MLILVIYSFNEVKAGDSLGGIFHQMVRRIASERSVSGRSLGHAQSCCRLVHLRHDSGHNGRLPVRGGTVLWAHAFLGHDLCPLVMPEVITGLSLLLLFIGIGLDRGVLTIVLAHTTFSMCFVSVVVSSRLISFDRSLEEAALDLGATLASIPTCHTAHHRARSDLRLAAGLHARHLMIWSSPLRTGPVRDHTAHEDMVICPAWGQPRNQRPQFYSDRIGVYRRDHSVARVQATLSADQARRTGRSAHYMRRIFSNYAYGPEPRLNCLVGQYLHTTKFP